MTSLFLTAAVLGNFSSRAQNINLPITPAEIACDALASAEAGAAIVHIHVRDPETEMPRTNLLVPDDRVQHVLAIKPDIATLDLNTMVFGQEVVINTLSSIRRMGTLIQDAGVRPEIELFDSGDVAILNTLMDEQFFEHPPLCSIVMGVKFGFVPLPETLLYARGLLPSNAIWTGFGTGAMAFPMVAQSALMGGNIRIGMEDAVWLAKGVKAPSNAAMVEKAARIVNELGFDLETPKQVRARLGL